MYAARYFFLMRRGESGLVFDVDLAKSQTEENPVFYVQMAHARMSGIFRVAGRDPAAVAGTVTPEALPAPEDRELLKQVAAFPAVTLRAAEEREPHRITGYLEELARVAHGWYHKCRVLGEPPEVEQGRLLLARATREVLANGLTLLGCTAPDRMWCPTSRQSSQAIGADYLGIYMEVRYTYITKMFPGSGITIRDRAIMRLEPRL